MGATTPSVAISCNNVVSNVAVRGSWSFVSTGSAARVLSGDYIQLVADGKQVWTCVAGTSCLPIGNTCGAFTSTYRYCYNGCTTGVVINYMRNGVDIGYGNGGTGHQCSPYNSPLRKYVQKSE